MNRSNLGRPRSHAGYGCRSARSGYDSDEEEAFSGRERQGGRHPRRSRRSSHCYDDHAYGDDQFPDEDDEPRFPGPLINPVPIPVVGGYVPPMSYREAMVPGGMEPGGSSRKFEKTKKEKKKQYHNGPLPALRESWDEPFESGPPRQVQGGANLQAIAEAAPYLNQNLGIPNYLGNLHAMALPVAVPVAKPKLPEVTSKDPVVLSSVNRIGNAFEFAASKHDQVFSNTYSASQDKSIASSTGGLRPPEAVTDDSFSDSESEETGNAKEDRSTLATGTTEMPNKSIAEMEEDEDDYGFTDTESEDEGVIAQLQPHKNDPQTLQDITFTDSEPDEAEAVKAARITSTTGPTENIMAEKAGNEGYGYTGSESEAVEASLDPQKIYQQHYEDDEFSDSEPEGEEKAARAAQPQKIDPKDLEVLTLTFTDSETEETANRKSGRSAQVFEANQNKANAGYEDGGDYGFTDTESEEEVVSAAFDRNEIIQSPVNLAALTFTDSEAEEEYAKDITGKQNITMTQDENVMDEDYGFTDTESENEGKAVITEPLTIVAKPKPIEIYIWSDSDED